MKNRERKLEISGLALVGGLLGGGNVSADNRVHARLYDSGDPTTVCTFSEDGQSAECVAPEGTNLSVGYACPEGWRLHYGPTNLETVTAPDARVRAIHPEGWKLYYGDKDDPETAKDPNARVRAIQIGTHRALVARSGPVQEVHHVECAAPGTASTPSPSEVSSHPQRVPLKLVVTPGRPNLRSETGETVVEVDRPIRDQRKPVTRLTVNGAGFKTMGEGEDPDPMAVVEGSVGIRDVPAFANESPLVFGLGVTAGLGRDVTERRRTFAAPGATEPLEETETARNIAHLSAGPELRLCTPKGLICGDVALQAGMNVSEENALFLGKGGVDVGVIVRRTEEGGIRAKIGRMRGALRLLLRAIIVGGKDGDSEFVAAGGGLGVEY